MTVEGGILETGGIKIGDNGKLINKGELIVNGNFEGNGTIVNTLVQLVEMEMCRKETEQILVSIRFIQPADSSV